MRVPQSHVLRGVATLRVVNTEIRALEALEDLLATEAERAHVRVVAEDRRALREGLLRYLWPEEGTWH